MNWYVFLIIMAFGVLSLSIAVTTVIKESGAKGLLKFVIGLFFSLFIGVCIFYTLARLIVTYA